MEVFETLRSSAMFRFRRVVVYNLTCVRKKACTRLRTRLREVRPMYNVYTHVVTNASCQESLVKCCEPFASYSQTFFAQYCMTVKSWLPEKWSRAKLKNGFEYTTSFPINDVGCRRVFVSFSLVSSPKQTPGGLLLHTE